MTRGRAVVLLLLALACAAISAAPKVPMKIVARPKIGGAEELVVEPPEEPVVTGPVLRRQPMPPQGNRRAARSRGAMRCSNNQWIA